MTRPRNPRVAKALLSYTIDEAARAYRVHKNTVRHWLANGLETIDDKRPAMIHGTALRRFHEQNRAAGKKACGPGELYCLRCRQPRRPDGDIADYTAISQSVGSLVAICSECGRLMCQRVNAARLAQFELEIDVTVRLAR